MPRRFVSFVNGNFYHILNRSIHPNKLFLDERNYAQAIDTLNYYKFFNTPFSFSRLKQLHPTQQFSILSDLRKNPPLVEVIAFCLMPNHIHLLVRQKMDFGISKFVANFQNSYTRHLNIKNERKGYVFEGVFKAVHIAGEEQLIHTYRYIILNPYSSEIVKKIDEIETYPYSSLVEYAKPSQYSVSDTAYMLNRFGSYENLKAFVQDNAEHQKALKKIKSLTLD
ncbi:MAG: transposase [Patescibacteria group bacterium]